MLKYDESGIHIHENEDGFDLSYQCPWADVFLNSEDLIMNHMITGLWQLDNAVYITLEKTEGIRKYYRLLKITSGLMIHTMGMNEATYHKIIDALNHAKHQRSQQS